MFWNRKKTAPKTYTIQDFLGTYRGFSPTDESAVGMGELEITITEESVKTRMATGLEIIEGGFRTSDFSPMPKELLGTVFNTGSEYLERCIGFLVGNVKYVFTPDAKEGDIGLIVKWPDDTMIGIMGPTLLLSPAQVKAGQYDKALENKEFNNQFPQLRYDGKTKPKGS